MNAKLTSHIRSNFSLILPFLGVSLAVLLNGSPACAQAEPPAVVAERIAQQLKIVAQKAKEDAVKKEVAQKEAEVKQVEAVNEAVATTEEKKDEKSKTVDAKKDDAKKTEKAEVAGEAAAETKEGDAKDEKAKDDKDEKKQEKNPLANFIKGIFGRPNNVNLKPAMPADPDEGKENQPANGLKTARDNIDERAPYIREHASLLRTAKTRIESNDWKAAIEVLQSLLDSPDNSVYRESQGEFKSIRTEVHRIIGTAPADVLRQYRAEYGGLADRMLEEANELNDPDQLAAVVSRFFHTDAGYQAADRIGTMHLDRGEFVSASYWFSRLLEASAGMTTQDSWKAKASIAFKKVGQLEKKKVWGEVASLDNEINPMIGGEKRSLKDWLVDVDQKTPWSTLIQEDWNVMYGSPSRNTHAVGGEPLLIKRWSHPTTVTNKILTQLETLIDDLTSNKRATIPTFVPITVDGKVIYRTFKGIAVVEVATGKLLWESAEVYSPEHILTGSPVQPQFFIDGPVQSSNYSPYYGGSADSHPLTSLLYRNGNYGTVSSDGTRVYCVTNNALLSQSQPGYYYGYDPQQNDGYRRDWSSNRITAYDLNTGRIRWVIGGREMNEPFDPPMAGTFFFGAPVPANGMLYAIGEKGSEIRLFAIDPTTGEQAWSQLIAYAEAKIKQDLGRRWWTAQPAVGNGVIICPTTVGWLVAVDRISHEVLWAHRYTKPKSKPQTRSWGQNTGVAMTSTGTLNSRWSPSAPIISGNRVIYTPSEEGRLFCLNLITGEPEWAESRSRNDGLYPAGIVDDSTIIVGTSGVSAVSLKNGTVEWTHTFEDSDDIGKPSGRAIIVDDKLLLPFQSGQLWMMDLAEKERKITRFYLNNDDLGLGNLLLYEGTLLSMTPDGLTAFEQRQAVDQEIARRTAKDPNDPWAKLKLAEIEFAKRRFDETIALVREVSPESLADQQLKEKRHQLLKDCLVAVVSSELAGRDAEFKELGEMVTGTQDELLYKRIAGERFVARKQYEQAFEHFLSLAKTDQSRLVSDIQNRDLDVRSDIWLKRRLIQVWESAPDEIRTRFQETVANSIGQAVNAGDESALSFAYRFYGFHPDFGNVLAARAKLAREAGNFADAEAFLMELINSGTDLQKANATLELAEILASFGHREDAKFYLNQAEKQFGQVALERASNTKTVSEIVLARLESMDSKPLPSFIAAWNAKEFVVKKSGTNYYYNTETPAIATWSDLPFWHKHRLSYSSQTKRLDLVNSEEEKVWSLPLRSRNGFSQGQYLPVHPIGHRFVVLHQGVVQCFSLPDRKVVWSHPVKMSTTSSAYMRNPSIYARQVPKARHATGTYNINNNSSKYGLLAFSTSKIVCYHGRRQLIALDTQTGDVIWIRNRVPRNSTVIGDEEYLYIAPPDRSKSICLNSTDGTEVAVKDLSTKLGTAIANVGHKLVRISSQSSSGILGLSKPGTKLTLVDPITDKVEWTVSVNPESYISLLNTDQIVSLDPSRAAQLIDLKTGKKTEFGEIPESAMKSVSEVYTYDDTDNIYLVINKRTRGYSSSYLSLRSIRIRNGSVVALNKNTGKVAWNWDVESKHDSNKTSFSTHLLLDHLDKSPLLLFASRKSVHKENVYYQMVSLVAVDKQTGKVVLDHKAATNNSFRSVKFNMADRYIDLNSYNERYRIQAVVQQAEGNDIPPEPATPEGT